MQEDEFKRIHTAWGRILLQDNACASLEEASVLAEILLEEWNDCDKSDLVADPQYFAPLELSLEENLGLSNAKDLAQKLSRSLAGVVGKAFSEGGGSENDDKTNVETTMSPEDKSDEEEEDGIALFDGECELCDRYIKLTKHHLIPRSTWSRLEVKLMHAAEAIDAGNAEKAAAILGSGLQHLLVKLRPQKSTIRNILHETCNICRPCHTTLHRRHDNLELALRYSTIDLLLGDGQIASFCKWASKQRPGKHAVI